MGCRRVDSSTEAVVVESCGMDLLLKLMQPQQKSSSCHRVLGSYVAVKDEREKKKKMYCSGVLGPSVLSHKDRFLGIFSIRDLGKKYEIGILNSYICFKIFSYPFRFLV